MMVKNEEKNLERCLKSLQPMRNAFPSELIIVDTGSDDDTVAIAKRFTDQVYFHPWQNNFSEMRNITLSYGKGEWILIIDADEELHNCQPLIDFLKSSRRNQYGAVAFTTKNIVNTEDPHAYSTMVGFRIFKNDRHFHYEGAVHNQAKFRGEALAMPEVYLLHYGYVATDEKLMERKFLRTSMILKQELEKDPYNIYYWTQLSVTYAMHNDYVEAIEYAEKAYSLLPEERTPNYMFVLLHLILIYQHEKLYDKVAKFCREALSIKDGYLDVYYYYAESQAVLKNYSESVNYYEKYLDLLAQRQERADRDVTIIEYTLGFEQIVYSNLLRLYKDQKNYLKAIDCVEKLTNEQFLKNNMVDIIYLYLVLQKYEGLRSYYDHWITEKDIFFDQLMKLLGQLKNSQAELELAQAFRSVGQEYGLLCSLIIDDHDGYITEETQQKVLMISLDKLPVYCSGIFYYLLKWHYPLEKIITNYKEVWLTCALEYIDKQYDALGEILYRYLEKYTCAHRIQEYKLAKTLARCALLVEGLSDEQCRETFERYVKDGICYLQMTYNSQIIDETMIYEVKNDEEVFLLYMHNARKYSKQQREYVRYLRLALQAFPGMKRGIEFLVKEIKNESNEKQQEFEGYKKQVKTTIHQLIEAGKMNEAKNVLDQYKSLVTNDLEVVLLESKILLN